jgi:hypothetical protein
MKSIFKLFYALSVARQLGFLIIITFLGFLFLGILCDKIFFTKPIFTLIGLTVGLIVCVYDTYYLILPILKKEE